MIARNGRPVARIVPYRRRAAPRVPGGWTGQVWMADDFDEPTGEYAEMVDQMYDGPVLPPDEHLEAPTGPRP